MTSDPDTFRKTLSNRVADWLEEESVGPLTLSEDVISSHTPLLSMKFRSKFPFYGGTVDFILNDGAMTIHYRLYCLQHVILVALFMLPVIFLGRIGVSLAINPARFEISELWDITAYSPLYGLVFLVVPIYACMEAMNFRRKLKALCANISNSR